MEPLYECRARRGLPLLVLALGVAFAVSLGEPVWLAALFVLLLSARVWQTLRAPLVRVFPDRLEYRPYVPSPSRAGHPTLRELLLGAPRVVRGDEIQELAWDGSDNVAVRMRDGGLECVSFYLARPAERAAVRERVLAFVERATGGAPRAA